MMEKKYTIGLDFGTSSGRAVLVETETGRVAAGSEACYPHRVMDQFLPDGTKLGADWALQHPQDYIEVMEKTVRAVMKKSKVEKEQVIGLAIDFTSCTILPVDAEKKPLCMIEKFVSRPHAYAKLWKHHAAWREADYIEQQLHVKLSSELLLPKILEILNEDYEVYHSADQILEAGDWLGQILTGTRARSASMASYKAMWNKEEGYGLSQSFRILHPLLEDLTETKLSGEIYYPGECIGYLLPEWAARLGLTDRTAVSAGIIDAHAAVPGCGITKPGQMMLAIGTSTVQVILEDIPYMDEGVYGNVRDAVVSGHYAWESGIAAAGDTYQWFIEKCISAEYASAAEREREDIYRYLEKKAQILNPGAGGMLALEWWNGNKTPYMDSGRRGVMVGYTLSTKPEEIYRALLEATAFGTKRILEAFNQAGVNIREIYACGGIPVKNDLLMQICADVLGCEIRVSATEYISALGAAMYAAVAAGKEQGGHLTIQEAAYCMKEKQKRIFRPVTENVKKYQELYALYRQLSELFQPGKNDLMTRLKEFA